MCILGDRAEPVFGVPGTKKGCRKASRRGLHSTCPGGTEQLLLQDLNHSLMAFKHRRWLHLATQLRICISKERRALPSPRGKIGEIASCWRGINGAGTKGSLILRRGSNGLHQLLIIPPTPTINV